MRRRFFVIFNPGAGRSRRALLDRVVQRLVSAGASVMLCASPDMETARAEALGHIRDNDCDAIVAAGGDGTIRLAASVVVGTPMALGFVPLGTGNVLAHELGLDRSPHALAEMLLYGPAQPITCGEANAELFVLMAGAGFDGRSIAALNARTKVRFGKLAYAGPMLAALARPVDRFEVTVDGVLHHANWVVVTNTRHYGGRYAIAPDQSLLQPGLTAVLFKGDKRRTLLRHLVALGLNRLERGPEVDMLPCTHVLIASRIPAPCQIDGDQFGMTPLEVRRGQAVKLITPIRNATAP
jgi:diacylglycerol kinase (ATP)